MWPVIERVAVHPVVAARTAAETIDVIGLMIVYFLRAGKKAAFDRDVQEYG
jgi:hypothetical protein